MSALRKGGVSAELRSIRMQLDLDSFIRRATGRLIKVLRRPVPRDGRVTEKEATDWLTGPDIIQFEVQVPVGGCCRQPQSGRITILRQAVEAQEMGRQLARRPDICQSRPNPGASCPGFPRVGGMRRSVRCSTSRRSVALASRDHPCLSPWATRGSGREGTAPWMENGPMAGGRRL